MTRTVGDYYLQIYRKAGQTPELVHLGALSHRDALSEFFAAISNVRSSKNPRQTKAQRVCLGRITEPRSICGTNTQIRSQASANWTDRPNTNFPELDTPTMYYDQDAQQRSTPGSYLGAFYKSLPATCWNCKSTRFELAGEFGQTCADCGEPQGDR